jgi:hypothetical protein
MNYELMHKNKEVAVLTLDIADGQIFVSDFTVIADQEHLPVGILFSSDSGDMNRVRMQRWLTQRGIPKGRLGHRGKLGFLYYVQDFILPHPDIFLLDSMGLSLSDTYWLRPTGTDIAWKDVNFFENGFSEDLGDVLLGKRKYVKKRKYVSPDATIG